MGDQEELSPDQVKVAAIFEQARRSAERSKPKQHHIVPRSYLQRWAEGGMVRVTHIDHGRSHLSPPDKAAREAHYYSLESPDVDSNELPPLAFETMLGEVEQVGKAAIDRLLVGGPLVRDPRAIADLAMYLGFQITRGHAFRAEQQELSDMYFRLRYQGIGDDGIRALLRDRGAIDDDEAVQDARQVLERIVSGEIQLREQTPALVARSGKLAIELGEHLVDRNWVVYRTPPTLITSDEPVVMIGGPGQPRDERAGVASAGIVIFPLAPDALLAMLHTDMPIPKAPLRLSGAEVAEVNHEILGAASRWAFERPSRHMSEKLRIPSAPSAFAIEGPLPHPDGHRDVYRNYKPTRWAGMASPPPWPVASWWR